MSKDQISKNFKFKWVGELQKYTQSLKPENWFLIYSLIVILCSFFVFFFNYQNPPSPFWDESYHIASAQKYIDGVYFQEPHPPLGKLFIALGEKAFNQNPKQKFEESYKKEVEQDLSKDSNIRHVFDENSADDRQKLQEKRDKYDFTKTDFIEKYPEGYSFAGVRFFAALFAFLAGYLFFLLAYQISKNYHLAFFISSFYIFNNALALHFRGAMLDGILMFFVLASLLYFTWLYRKSKKTLWHYFGLGFLIGLAIMTKVNSGVLLLLFPFLMYSENLEYFKNLKLNWKKVLDNIIFKGFFLAWGLVLVVFLVQNIHVILGKRVLENKTYSSSSELIEAINKKQNANPYYTFVSFKDWLGYSESYASGVPKLDVCKTDENGSSPLTWPIGDRTISYRWDKYVIKNSNWWDISAKFRPVTKTLDDYNAMNDYEKKDYEVVTQYLYLVPNPAAWLVSLIGVILSIVLLLGILFFGFQVKNKFLLEFISFFSILYLAYMVPVLFVERVLYLYHYFIPLVFGLILFYLLILNWLENKKDKSSIYLTLFAITIISLVCFFIFAPFTYYSPLTLQGFEMRNWFGFWKMRSS